MANKYYKAGLFLNQGKDKKEFLMTVIFTINEYNERCYEICTNKELIFDDVPYSPYYSVIQNISRANQTEVDNYVADFNFIKFYESIAYGVDTKDGNYSNKYVKEKVKAKRKELLCLK